ncbi:MAG TPA: TMEM175 family protein [Chitinophagaceae bacterium]|nr:TMEM175 family protein [Chitinophagaceae bacterium]
MTKTRLEAFSDGVIAIIITIMVIEIKAPHSPTWEALRELWPSILSYIVSFTMLGIYWGNHHHLIHTIKEVRGGIMWANLHLLFWLSLIPFATHWMGENHFEKNTIVTYAALADMCGIAYYILLIIIKKCNPGNALLQEVLNKQSRKGMWSCIFYTAAIPLAYVNTVIAGALIILVAIMWLMPDRNIERAIPES